MLEVGSEGRADISEEVRAILPSALSAALNEVEEVYRRPVPFYLVHGLQVNASGRADPQGLVELPLQSRTNLNVIGEEIMHLHRWTRQYPAIEPTTLAHEGGYGHDLAAIGGHFDEYAFFPFLESVGLDPRSELHPRVVEAVNSLEGGLLGRIPHVHGSGEFTLEWRVKLCRTHVAADLLSGPSPARDSLLEVFELEPLRLYAELGRRISTEIVDAREATPDQVAAHMHTCLFTHLGLPTNVATVRRVL